MFLEQLLPQEPTQGIQFLLPKDWISDPRQFPIGKEEQIKAWQQKDRRAQWRCGVFCLVPTWGGATMGVVKAGFDSFVVGVVSQPFFKFIKTLLTWTVYMRWWCLDSFGNGFTATGWSFLATARKPSLTGRFSSDMFRQNKSQSYL